MNAFNLLLVFTLKSSVKFINEHGGSGSHSTGAIVWEKASEAPIEPGCTGCTRKLRKSSRLFGGRSVQDTRTSQTESRETFALSTQDLAMKRLAADLTIAIPCVLAMVIIMVVGLGVLIQKQFERLTWTIQEFVSDICRSSLLRRPITYPPLSPVDHRRILLYLHDYHYHCNVFLD